jgi:hypothetical protein
VLVPVLVLVEVAKEVTVLVDATVFGTITVDNWVASEVTVLAVFWFTFERVLVE